MVAEDFALDPKLAARLEPSVVDRLQEWQQTTGNRLSLEAWITSGNTPAVVGVAMVTGSQPPAKVIMKACPPERLTSREPRLHTEALAVSPASFSSNHLVDQPFDTIESADKWRVLFQSIAGDSLRSMRPLESVLHDDCLPELVSIIVSSLLHEWNPTYETHQVTPSDLLRSELGPKLDQNGPLVEFASSLQVAEAPWIRFGDSPSEVLPNALAWALNAEHWPSGAGEFWAHFGLCHGDLHPGNVLIRVAPAPRATDFRLIDLSSFSSNHSLAKDAVHLLLSVIGEHLSEVASHQRDLLTLAMDESAHLPLELRGLRETARRVRKTISDWQSSMHGMSDDWDAQFNLAFVAGSLEFVGRHSLPPGKRLWFYKLSCRALDRFLTHGRIDHAKPEDPAAVLIVGPVLGLKMTAAVEQLLSACGHFTGTHATIAVLSRSLPSSADEHVGGCPWTAVMSFDPELDDTGALARAKTKGQRLHRLVTQGQSAQYAHGSTTWTALGGLSDQAEATIVEGFRPWRRSYRKTIDEGLQALGRHSVRPITVAVFGTPDDRVRTVVEAVDDRFGERAHIVLINDGSEDLGEYTDAHLVVDATALLSTLPCEEEPKATAASVPGHDGPIVLQTEDEDWIREGADLVDSLAGTNAGPIDDVGYGFLRGRTVSWFELGLDLDVVPRIASEIVGRVREDLEARDTRRVSLLHHPGAGGTTLARRVAWEVHADFPTLYCAATHDEAGLAQRVSRLAQITGLPVLLVLEHATDVTADQLYNRLRGDSIPAVILIVSRRLTQPRDSGSRSFYLGPASNEADVAALLRRYAEYAPERLDVLGSIRAGEATAVPFYFGLLAFQDEYEGLEDYVARFLADLAPNEAAVIQIVALIHRYAGIPVAGDLFSDVLSIPSDSPVDLSRSLTEAVRGLLIEDGPGFWRTIHWLVAAEVLRQLLTPASGDSEAWRLALSAMAVRVIDEVYEVFGSDPPDDIRDVLTRLFVVRENVELYGDLRQRSFSELLEAIPSLEGRLEVLRHLAESFPEEPHFWAHYGRLLSYEAGDTKAALVAVNQALALNDNDSVFHHIRGMVYRRRLRDLAQQRSTAQVEEDEILRLAELAMADFSNAAHLDDESEYPHVATIQVAVDAIELSYGQSECGSYAEFLGRITSSPYRMLLEAAESAVDSLAEIRGPDPMSTRGQEAVVSLNQLYDDYSALLEGWRNLLVRDDVLKAPLRRRLVRAYVRRAGQWADLSAPDNDRVLSLLEENLRDDPTDSRSLRDWLRAARTGGASLDRASELVSYWATQNPSRDSLYYDYVISVLQVLAGRESSWREASRKVERCKERSASFANRKFSYEWLGQGKGLATLVHYTDLPPWDRSEPTEVPRILRKVPARIASIGSPQAGTLRLEQGGLDAFFVPARAGAIRGRHENARVETVIGFSYDGLRAWSVRLMPTSNAAAGR